MARRGVDVEIITLKHKDIRSCTGCWACWLRNDGRCVFDDDMSAIIDHIDKADIVVYAFPIYVDGVPGMVKNFLDRQTRRIYPYMVPGIGKTRHPRRSVKEQYYVVLSTCGFPEMGTFTPMVHHFEAIAHNHHVPVITYLLTPQGNNLFNNPLYYPQLIEKVEALEMAGEQIIDKGKVDKNILKKISATTSPKRMAQWQTEANRFWQNKIDKKSNSY
jgi:multimeric flavodoxin WrbA